MPRNVIAAVVLLWGTAFSSTVAAAAQTGLGAKDGPALFLVLKNLHLGYIDRKGKVVIKPTLVRAREFSEGLAAVATTDIDKRGYMDQTGELAIKPSFYKAYDFHDGMAKVRLTAEEKYGYIDRTGEIVVKPRFVRAEDFSEGLAWVATTSRTWGVIDKSGEMIVEPVYYRAGTPFSAGLSTAEKRIEEYTSAHDVIDSHGNVLLAPGKRMGPFSDGMAWYRDPRNGYRGYVDATCKPALSVRYDGGLSFSEGFAAIRLGELYGYIDKRGRTVVKPQFYTAKPFSEGMAAVQLEKGHRITRSAFIRYQSKWSYVDTRGRLAVAPRLLFDAGPFSEGYATVIINKRKKQQQGGKTYRIITDCGVIDKHGRLIFEQENCEIMPFRNGLAKVKVYDENRLNYSYGYVDTFGRYVWKPQR